jgi:hypothetical protein
MEILIGFVIMVILLLTFLGVGVLYRRTRKNKYVKPVTTTGMSLLIDGFMGFLIIFGTFLVVTLLVMIAEHIGTAVMNNLL